MPTIIRRSRAIVYRVVYYPHDKVIRPSLTWGQQHPVLTATIAIGIAFGVYYFFWV